MSTLKAVLVGTVSPHNSLRERAITTPSFGYRRH